ncbi:terminase small subunit [Chitinophaga lutea]|uniref:Terminase small subunit n=1 Tax=Chitinophaga lutea TaxID=2488634 RepID=A0A3N4Q1A4_9BACT|nr:terminase small subunit [Chitinophaga lutea]RPE05544.1 terminase small subunit [Chitinophaga lutea]
MALKPQQKKFAKHYVQNGDHIESYLKVFPKADRKLAASSGKRWLKHAAIAAEIERLQQPPIVIPAPDPENTANTITLTPLEPQQKRFCEEYIIDLNATAAAIRAGYSENSAGSQASDLLKKANIQHFVRQLMGAREQRTEIKADRVLEEIAYIAFARVTDFVKVEAVEEDPTGPIGFNAPEEDDEPQPKRKDSKTTYKIVDVFPTDGIAPEKMAAVASIKQGRNGIEIKLHDKTKCLELLGRHLAMWNDKLQVSTDDELKNLFKTVMGGE